MIGCGGADGIDLDKNAAHIELQEKIGYEQRLAKKKFENAMAKQEMIQKTIEEEKNIELQKKLDRERMLKDHSPDAAPTDKKQFKIIKVKQNKSNTQ